MIDKLDRETLGKLVRQTWIEWAKEQPNPKPSWLVEWDNLSEPDQEVDRRIGEAVAMYVAKESEQSELAMMIISSLQDLVKDFCTYTTKYHKFWQDQLAERQALIDRANRLLD
jgi:hypothetical protein